MFRPSTAVACRISNSSIARLVRSMLHVSVPFAERSASDAGQQPPAGAGGARPAAGGSPACPDRPRESAVWRYVTCLVYDTLLTFGEGEG